LGLAALAAFEREQDLHGRASFLPYGSSGSMCRRPVRKFGRYLEERGLITREQIDEALNTQVAFGGRLGTNLVELGYLKLDDVANQLSGFLGSPLPPTAWFETPDTNALRALPKALIEKRKLIPLRVDKTTLHVVSIDPRHEKIAEEIAFSTTRAVQLYVLPELRMYYWLEKLYGIKRDVRFMNVNREMAQGRFKEPTLPEEKPRTRSHEPREPLRALPKGQDLIDDATFHQTYAFTPPTPGSERSEPKPTPPASPGIRVVVGQAAPPSAEPPPPEHTTLELVDMVPEEQVSMGARIAQLEAEMMNAAERAQIIDSLISLAGLFVESAALFIVQQGIVQGAKGSGPLAERPLDGILFPVQTESLLTKPVTTGEAFRAKVADLPNDARLLRAMGREEALEVLAIPIKVRSRVVNVLYIDGGSDPIPYTSESALRALCDHAGAAFEHLILIKKRQES
jgi:hypothetical protein